MEAKAGALRAALRFALESALPVRRPVVVAVVAVLCRFWQVIEIVDFVGAGARLRRWKSINRYPSTSNRVANLGPIQTGLAGTGKEKRRSGM